MLKLFMQSTLEARKIRRLLLNPALKALVYEPFGQAVLKTAEEQESVLTFSNISIQLRTPHYSVIASAPAFGLHLNRSLEGHNSNDSAKTNRAGTSSPALLQ